MARPKRCRWIGIEPNTTYFKPRGIPMANLEDVILTVDEMEAVRLADLEGLYQEAAARRMNVSRQTFGRIVAAARRKIADAIIHGKALRIDGGEYIVAKRVFRCSDCEHTWQVPYGTGRPGECPACHCGNIHRADEDKGCARRGGNRRGPCDRGGPPDK